jgi:hypothetical protein
MLSKIYFIHKCIPRTCNWYVNRCNLICSLLIYSCVKMVLKNNFDSVPTPRQYITYEKIQCVLWKRGIVVHRSGIYFLYVLQYCTVRLHVFAGENEQAYSTANVYPDPLAGKCLAIVPPGALLFIPLFSSLLAVS